METITGYRQEGSEGKTEPKQWSDFFDYIDGSFKIKNIVSFVGTSFSKIIKCSNGEVIECHNGLSSS